MSAETLETRVAQLERQLAELQLKLAQGELFDHASKPSRQTLAADDPYWEQRERRLAKIKFIPPIDSTAAVSEDRERQ